MNTLDSMALNAETPTKVVLINPATDTPIRDKDGKDAYLMMMSADSKVAQDHRRKATTKQLKKRDRTKTTAEEVEESNIELLAALTTGWYLVNFDGEPVEYEFSVGNARALYSRSDFTWIKEQADAGAGDRGNFMKAKSSQNSGIGQTSNSL